MSVFRLISPVVLFPLVLSTALAATDPLYKSMREAGIADTRVVENIEIKRDTGILTLKTGAIGFTAPANGRDTIAVFAGEGEFKFTATSPLDRAYMTSLTGQTTFTETFDRASALATIAARRSALPRRHRPTMRSSPIYSATIGNICASVPKRIRRWKRW